MPDKFAFIDAELQARQILGRRRFLQTTEADQGAMLRIGDRPMLNFCSNDYLGLSRHPLLIERARQFTARFGAGSTSSRLICGNHSFFEPVEERLAALKGTEAALIFNSGFQANTTVLAALADRESLILSDRLNHNSLIQGARLARCRIDIFDHNDMDHLRKRLAVRQREEFSRILIVTESIFSMDGDQCPLDELVAIARASGAILVVDEAHATGVSGPQGMGLTCGKGVDVVIGTFSKACGAFGAYVAGTRKMRDYLLNCCAGIIYSTALPPGVLGAVSAALELIPGMQAERKTLHAHAGDLRTALDRLGWDCGRSTTHIVPVMAGRENEAVSLSAHLAENNIFAGAIRPPTVEENKSRIRLAVTAVHRGEDIEKVIDAFARWSR
ncbi:MAG: 8-amino-7-oxononanoate synthase [Desulfobacteraceae bacterium]|nr:MAG: 8-amino-7-oxononanoate synthase [Desulfobacteraceae bacterium]